MKSWKFESSRILINSVYILLSKRNDKIAQVLHNES